MLSPYHAGELAVQKRVGVREQADDLIGMFRDEIPPTVAEFLAQHRFAVLSSRDSAGDVWASPLAGPPGILSVPDPHAVSIRRESLDPPLASDQVSDGFAGLLAIDFDRRLRLRINGALSRSSEDMNFRVGQLYGNCTKYIQRRLPCGDGQPQAPAGAVAATALSDAQRAWIARSDTFFIATSHAEFGADASHRGGRPGFVQAADEHTLTWPDYRGNNLFNTLGNLEIDARCGLLFVDFESGAALQLTGAAGADFGDPTSFVPTGRRIRFEITRVRELAASASLRYTLSEPFPYNPPVG